MQLKKRGARWLAVLLSFTLMTTAVPLSTALAEDDPENTGQITSSSSQDNNEATIEEDTDQGALDQKEAGDVTANDEKSDQSVLNANNADLQETNGAVSMDQNAAELRSSSEIYVSSVKGSDSNNGSKDAPYATLAKAVEMAEDGATIYVMSNLEMNKCARFYNKSLTITSGEGGPYTLSRSDSFEHFESQSDTARSWYNPALIEVGNTSEGAVPTQLTLTNIVLDDNFKHEGTYFIQAASKGGGTDLGSGSIDNLNIVQDAMVATYAPSVTINLGDGAVLKDFGGMSAVRLTGGSHFVMQNGSKIYDSESFTRAKGTTNKDEYGPAGAIWSQSGNVTIENGASIENVNGRAIYMDGGEVTVDGTISGIKSNKNAMWQGDSGFIIHLRGDAQAKIGQHGVIDGASVESSGTAIEVLEGSQLTADEGSVIKNINKGTVISTNGNVSFAGEITGCRGWAHAIVAQSGNFHIILEPSAYIHDNYCGYGAIYIQSTGGVLDIYGRINNNLSNDRGGAIAMANNFGGTKVNMYDGAEICGNVTYQTGGGIMVSRGTFTMNGGTIANNISGVGTDQSAMAGGGVFIRRGGQFIMNGGTIENNTAAGIGGNIAFEAGDYEGMVPYVQLNGGSVKNGTMKATITGTDGSFSTSGGEANDIAIAAGDTFGKTSRYLSVSNKVDLSDHNVFMDDYGFYLESAENAVKIGNASKDCEDKAKTSYTDENLTSVVGSYWYETKASTETFTISDLDFDKTKSLYAAVVATDEEGKPVQDAAVTLHSVKTNEDGSFSLSLPGQSATGYAVVFLQEGPDQEANVLTVTPVDVTVYEGGKGYTAVVDGSETTTNNSMPHPLFKITGIEDASGLTFSNGVNNKTWTVVSDGNGYYHFQPGKNQENVRVTYTNAAGETVTSDEFDVSSAGDTFEQFVIALYLGDNNLAHITATAGNDDTYAVALGTGTLTVRAIQASSPDAVVSNIESKAPSKTLESGTALAVEPEGGTTYTLNNTGVKLPDDAQPSLLFDDIIASDGIDRESALKTKVDDQLGGADSTRQYQMKYLDLVDANNSNAWITSSNGIDIYWAYPEGTDENTNFSLIHFKGLHRDGENSGYDTDDIDVSEVEAIDIEKTEAGIKFHVPAGGFSPYVLTWSTGEQTGTNPSLPGDNQEQTGDPDQNSDLLAKTGDMVNWAAPFGVALIAAIVALGAYRAMRRKH